MLLSGLGMGAVFDSYRILSLELKFPRWWLPFLDLLYWVAAALIVFRVLYAGNNGEVRVYVFLGLLLGVTVYYFLFSRMVAAIVRWTILAVRGLIRFIIGMLDWTIVKPLVLLYKLIKVIFSFGAAITIFLLKVVLQLFRPFWLLAKWMLGPVIRPIAGRLGPHLDRLRLGSRLRDAGNRIAERWKKLIRKP